MCLYLLLTTQIQYNQVCRINYIEYIIISEDGAYSNVDYNYTDYSFPTNGTVTSNDVSEIIISPESDLTKRGVTVGKYNLYYNEFVRICKIE